MRRGWWCRMTHASCRKKQGTAPTRGNVPTHPTTSAPPAPPLGWPSVHRDGSRIYPRAHSINDLRAIVCHCVPACGLRWSPVTTPGRQDGPTGGWHGGNWPSIENRPPFGFLYRIRATPTHTLASTPRSPQGAAQAVLDPSISGSVAILTEVPPQEPFQNRTGSPQRRS